MSREFKAKKVGCVGASEKTVRVSFYKEGGQGFQEKSFFMFKSEVRKLLDGVPLANGRKTLDLYENVPLPQQSGSPASSGSDDS